MSDNPDTPTTPATPATQSAVGTLVQPKPAEALFVLHVLSNQEGKPKVDWAKVATAVGLKNAATASVRFGQIKKRLGWTDAMAGGSGAGAGAGRIGTPTPPGKAAAKRTPGSGGKVTKPRVKTPKKKAGGTIKAEGNGGDSGYSDEITGEQDEEGDKLGAYLADLHRDIKHGDGPDEDEEDAAVVDEAAVM